MRITESRLRRIIRSVIVESIDDMSSDRMGSRPESYAGMGGAPSADLNDRYLVAIADVCMGMESYDIDRMCKEIEECDPSLKKWCDELPEQIRMGNERGVLDCLYHICENHECCKICIKCCV